jgi:CDP-6-deoxy-D-xylo-4-hexulose-3-dehydrase
VGTLENSDLVMNQLFWIGVFPGLTRPMLDYMVEVLHAAPTELAAKRVSTPLPVRQ